MAKGASIRFLNYGKSVSDLLQMINLQKELKKHETIVLKVFLNEDEEKSTSVEFAESVLMFVLNNKNPVSSVFIAEGSDGVDTADLFESRGYKDLAEKYEIGLVDLNNTECDEIENDKLLRFSPINYPTLLSNAFVISIPKLSENPETLMNGSLSNMLGALPGKYYKGLFSKSKNKLRKYPIKYAIHDSNIAKIPDLAIIDASENGQIFAGMPLEMDKEAAKILGYNWKDIPYIKILDESLSEHGDEEEIKLV